jgi:hypothetical protein
MRGREIGQLGRPCPCRREAHLRIDDLDPRTQHLRESIDVGARARLLRFEQQDMERAAAVPEHDIRRTCRTSERGHDGSTQATAVERASRDESIEHLQPKDHDGRRALISAAAAGLLADPIGPCFSAGLRGAGLGHIA